MHIATYYKHSQTNTCIATRAGIYYDFHSRKEHFFGGTRKKPQKNTLSTLHQFLQRTSPFQKREMNEFS